MYNNPKRLFLLDGLGALTSAALLFFLLSNFDDIFGVSKPIVDVLAGIALIFSVYSLSCFFLVKQKWKMFLSLIAITNIFYCLITAGYLYFDYPQLTLLGLLYFIGEIAIILTLVYLELTAVRKG
jgi:energy-converting hydrogenase Eha subunit G